MSNNSEKKLPLTDRHLALKRLKESRNAELSIELYLEGKLHFDDLTDSEQIIYDRIVWLSTKIKQNGKARFDRHSVLDEHCRRWDISEPTANRDLRIVNNQRKKLAEGELEFHKYYLLEKAFDAIELAEKDEFKGAAAKGMAANILAALKALGIDAKGKDNGTIDVSKIEQHVNILIADDMTNRIFKELLKSKISVLKHNTSLEEILALEDIAKEKASKLTPTDYEDIGLESAETGD